MTWLLAVLIVPSLSALLCLGSCKRTQINRAFGIAGAAVLLGVAIMLFTETWQHGYVSFQSGSWAAPFGITLIADLLSASMVLITGLIALLVALYSLKDIENRLIHSQYFALFHLLLLGVNGAFITGDLFNLYVWFEVMLLASFVLITLGGQRQQLEGGVKYLILNIVSSFFFLSGVGLIYSQLGTLNMADIALRLSATEEGFLIHSSTMLLLAAFGIKAAIFPFFFWLPASYHTPPIAISGLFAGLLTKVGVYALIRSYTLVFHSQFDIIQEILAFLAAATMVTGVLGAAAQYDLRKILSFHIVSQIGYMIAGLAIGSKLALSGTIFYILHHIIVKTNLFLIGGLIARRCGSSDLKVIGGLHRHAPMLAFLFFIPAFSLGGIPPLSGFWAKFSIVKASLTEAHYWLAGTALVVGVLTLYSMTKIWAEAFWKKMPTSHHATSSLNQTTPWSMIAPCVALAALTVAIGLFSNPLFELADATSRQLLDPDAYIAEVLKTRFHENSINMHP